MCTNLNLKGTYLKGILSTSCVIFSYPKLLSISVLTFIKWRLNTELLTSGSQLGWCCSTFCFLCNVMKIVVCPFVPFLLVIVLSILLLFTASPGGWLADRFGGRRVMGISMIICGISTILMPVCARTSIVLVYVLRIILGLASVSLFFFFNLFVYWLLLWRSLFVLLSPFSWSLYCLSFFYLQLLITPLVSSNISAIK
jgi:MFS family permease